MNTESSKTPASSNATRSKRRRLALGILGVTLIETLVALGLFSLVAATTSGFLVHQVKTAGINKRQTLAYVLAAEELERIRALDYTDMVGTSSEQVLENMTFTVDTTVENDTPASGMKKVSVDVGWPEVGGAENVFVYAIYTQVRR